MRNSKRRRVIKSQRGRRLSIAERFHRLSVEPLESRLCLSVFYDFNVIAKTGDLGITSFSPAPSINDQGNVALIGQTSNGDGIYVSNGTPTGPLKLISFNPQSNRNYGTSLQINNSDMVVARDRISGNPAVFTLRLWDANSTGTDTALGASNWPTFLHPFPKTFDSVSSFVSLSNDGSVGYTALKDDGRNRSSANASIAKDLCLNWG